MPAPSCCTEVTSAQLVQTLFPIGGSVVELGFDDVRSGHAGFQRGRRIERDQLAVIDDGDAVAEAVGFVHVVGGDQDGELALALDVGQHFPDGHAGDGIESGGGFVEKKDSRAVDQAAGDFQAPPHAAGQSLGLSGAPLGQIDQFQEFVDRGFPLLRGNIVELGVDVQILFDGEVEVAGQRLRNYAHQAAGRVRFFLHVVTEDAGVAGR